MEAPFVAVVAAAMTAVGAAIAWWTGGSTGLRLDPSSPVRIMLLGLLVLDASGAVALAATGESVAGALLVGGAFPAVALGTAGVAWLVGRPAPMAGPMQILPGRWWVAGLLVVAGLAAYGWMAVDHGIPLLAADPQGARAGFAGPRFDAFRWLVPPAAVLASAHALATGRRRAWLIAGVSIGGVIALEVLAASRALPFELAVAALLVAWWTGRRFRPRTWLLVGLAAATLFLGVLFARVGPDGGFRDPLDAATFAVNRTVGRVALIQPRTIDLIVRVFPDEEPFLGGETYVRWLAPLTGSERQPSLGTRLFERLFPDEPPGGFASPGLLGEAYANAGPLLALLAMVALGALGAWLGRVIPRWSADPATRTLAALLTVALLRTYATSLNGFLLTAAAAIAWWILVAAPLPGRFRRVGGSTRDRLRSGAG